MKRIDTPLARRYNVAEYFFSDRATENYNLVEEAVYHVYADAEHRHVKTAFERYLSGEALYFSTGICECLTAGFGECDYYGYFEFPLPMDFVDRFFVEKH